MSDEVTQSDLRDLRYDLERRIDDIDRSISAEHDARRSAASELRELLDEINTRLAALESASGGNQKVSQRRIEGDAVRKSSFAGPVSSCCGAPLRVAGARDYRCAQCGASQS